jgi:hypothetical protein
VRAYWLDLNFGKKKPVKVTKRKTNTARKKAEEKSSRPEGDYMEGAEGNVYVLRKTYQNETAASAQLRQNGYSSRKAQHSFR